jgi:uncharacterized membrane protein
MAQPAASDARHTDSSVQRTLGSLLRIGVILAAGFVLAGGAFYLLRHAGDHPDYSRFSGEPEDLTSVTGVARAALALRPRGLIQFGLLLLIATPVLRVAVSLVSFARERDRVYVRLTALVLLILLLSLLGILP